MDLIDIYRAFHTHIQQNIPSTPHEAFSKTDHILGHQSKSKHIEGN